MYVCMYAWMYVCLCMSMYVYVCLRMSMYVYVCLCMPIYVYVHLCMSLYLCMSMYVYVCLCMSMYVYVRLCMSLYLCMSMYVYVCLRVSMYVYVCLCMSMYVYVCLCMSMYVYVCLCMSMHVYVYVYVYVYVCLCMLCMHACMYVSMYLCMYVCMSMYVYVCLCMSMYVYVYVCMHVCMHACMYVWISLSFSPLPSRQVRDCQRQRRACGHQRRRQHHDSMHACDELNWKTKIPIATVQETSDVACAQERISSANWVASIGPYHLPAHVKGASHQKNFWKAEGRLNYTTRINPALFSSSRLRISRRWHFSSCLTPAPAAEGRSTEDLASMFQAAFESKSSEVTSLSWDVPSYSSEPRLEGTGWKWGASFSTKSFWIFWMTLSNSCIVSICISVWVAWS